MSHFRIGKIFDEFQNLLWSGNRFKESDLNQKQIEKILKKYNIDINYDNSLLLSLVCDGGGDDPNFNNIKLVMDMGADPRLLEYHDIITCEQNKMHYIRLDGIFKLYGYKCKWMNNELDEYDKLLYREEYGSDTDSDSDNDSDNDTDNDTDSDSE